MSGTAQLTANDRVLIDQAIAAGKITRIPRGVSGLDPIKGQDLRARSAALWANRRRAGLLNGPTTRQKRAATKAAIAEKRGVIVPQLKAMLAENMSFQQMADRLNMAKSSVWRLCRKHGLTCEVQS